MINRPPTPSEYLGRYYGFEQLSDCENHNNEMQEALTCEWLIEQGLMPDPTEHGIRGENVEYIYAQKKGNSVFSIDFELEDKTQ